MSVGPSELLVVAETTSTEIVSYLENSGYSVSNTTAEFCLPSIKQHSPDLVLLSIASQTVDNSDLLGCIKNLDDNLPIVLLVDKNRDEQVVHLLKRGATDFFAGSVGDSDLLAHIVEVAILRASDKRTLLAQEQRLKVLEQDLNAGSSAQNNLLPHTPAVLGDYKVTYRIYPSLVLSGDSVNYFELTDKRVLFYLADVSGHGAAGAVVSVALAGLSRRLKQDFDSLGLATSSDVLTWLNSELLALKLDQHITMFIGILDCKKNLLQYSNAAHFPGAIVKDVAGTTFLEMGGLPLGVCDTEYDSEEVKLSKTFKFVIFSDGVLEILSQATIKEKEEYLRFLVECENTDIDTLVDHLGLDDVVEVPDDIAVLTVERQV